MKTQADSLKDILKELQQQNNAAHRAAVAIASAPNLVDQQQRDAILAIDDGRHKIAQAMHDIRRATSHLEAKLPLSTDEEGIPAVAPADADMAQMSPILGLLHRMVSADWVQLDHDDPQAYRMGASTYCTLRKGPVIIAIAPKTILVAKRGDVSLYFGDNEDVALLALIVAPNRRREGLARESVRQLMKAASESGCRMTVEATPIEKRAITRAQLARFYRSLGWTDTATGPGLVLRAPDPRAPAGAAESAAPSTTKPHPATHG